MRRRKIIIFLLIAWGGGCGSQFSECHNDGGYQPEDGSLDHLQYTWLGVLQYIHVKNGTPHYFRAPRVSLLTRQFVLSTAADAALLPVGYALGNVVFGEYERDERECGLLAEDMLRGAACDRASLVLPLSDVLLHPEFKHFGAADSVALLHLLTPVRSDYMVPVCLPFHDHLSGHDALWHVDFTSDVPRDFSDEEKAVTRLHALPRDLCFLYDPSDNTTSVSRQRVLCSTHCGLHSGAPTVVHEHTGHFTLVALSQGGTACPDPLRARRAPPPARHVALLPYVPWITAAVSGRALGAFSKDDPFGYTQLRSDGNEINIHDQFHHWVGHWWMGGVRCYDRGDAASDLFKFYQEVFIVTPTRGAKSQLFYVLQIYGPPTASVVCMKVGMPYRLGRPKVFNLDSAEVQVRVPVRKFFHRYKFHVEGFAVNQSLVESKETGEQETASSSHDDDWGG